MTGRLFVALLSAALVVSLPAAADRPEDDDARPPADKPAAEDLRAAKPGRPSDRPPEDKPALNEQLQMPCASLEARQLDFWLGEWDLTWPAGAKGVVERGHNSVRRTFDGCVVEEHFTGDPKMQGGKLVGMSVSVWVPAARVWKQTWVDNQGGYLDFTGGQADGGAFILQREGRAPDGSALRQRMVFKNITRDSFDWMWERSTDGGKSWQLVWPIHYARGK